MIAVREKLMQRFGVAVDDTVIETVLRFGEADIGLNPAVIAAKELVDKGEKGVFIPYDYTVPLVVFACFGVLALLFAIYLKFLDKKRGYGLEMPNIKQ